MIHVFEKDFPQSSIKSMIYGVGMFQNSLT